DEVAGGIVAVGDRGAAVDHGLDGAVERVVGVGRDGVRGETGADNRQGGADGGAGVAGGVGGGHANDRRAGGSDVGRDLPDERLGVPGELGGEGSGEGLAAVGGEG